MMICAGEEKMVGDVTFRRDAVSNRCKLIPHTTMKRTFFTLILVMAAIVAGAATITPSKTYITQTLRIGSFTALRTNTAIDIEYTVGPQSVKLYAPDNLINYIKVSLSGGELQVSYKENMNIKGSHKSKLIVSAPKVLTFTVASAGDIKIKSNIKQTGNTVSLNTLSAGDIEAMNIEAKEVTCTTSSAGDIELSDLTATTVKLYANSAGDIKVRTLKARKDAHCYANSAGDISITTLYAGEEADIYANSAGDVKVQKLSAPDVSANTNSAGDVRISDIEANEVTAGSLSTGTVTVSGITDKATLISSSTGDVKASGLKALSVNATVHSSGTITCYPIQVLEGVCYSRNGEIRYAHKPNTRTKKNHTYEDEARGDGGIRAL